LQLTAAAAAALTPTGSPSFDAGAPSNAFGHSSCAQGSGLPTAAGISTGGHLALEDELHKLGQGIDRY